MDGGFVVVSDQIARLDTQEVGNPKGGGQGNGFDPLFSAFKFLNLPDIHSGSFRQGGLCQPPITAQARDLGRVLCASRSHRRSPPFLVLFLYYAFCGAMSIGKIKKPTDFLVYGLIVLLVPEGLRL